MVVRNSNWEVWEELDPEMQRDIRVGHAARSPPQTVAEILNAKPEHSPMSVLHIAISRFVIQTRNIQ